MRAKRLTETRVFGGLHTTSLISNRYRVCQRRIPELTYKNILNIQSIARYMCAQITFLRVEELGQHGRTKRKNKEIV